jgi:hypothetical protein
MDKLAKQLREDAAKINVEVSAQLDDRVRASLQGVTQEQARDNLPPVRPRSMWWASSLTGIAAAAALILVLNLNQPVPVPPQNDFAVPPILTPDLIFEKAMMTEPLEQELADLEADLKKAEEAVKKEIGLFP